MGDAKIELDDVRKVNVLRGDPGVSIWIHIAEGVFELTEGRERSAMERFLRARAVALAVGAAREASVIAAWLAYVAYTRNEFELMVTKVNEVAGAGDEVDLSALARARLLVGQAFHFAGKYELARSWYTAARKLAVDNGDDVLMSTLLFNVASLHVYSYRHYLLRGRTTSAPLDLLALTTESVRNYDQLVGIGSLRSYEGTLLASLHVFHKRYRDALEAFEMFLEMAEHQGLGRMKSLYVAEMSYCAAMLGDELLARRLAISAKEAVTDAVHVEDRAATGARLAQVFALLGESGASSEQAAIAEVHWARHEEFQREILGCLTRLDATGEMPR